MKIIVKNMRRVERAELEGSGILLLAGNNGQGKSSTLNGIAMAVTGELWPDDRKKGEVGSIVHAGQAEGMVSVEYGGGAVRAFWPKGNVTIDGEPPPVSAVAAGLDVLTNMDTPSLARVLAPVIKADPSEADFRQALKDEGINDETAKAAWEKIQGQSWDEAHKLSQQAGTKLKAGWEDITGEKRWGSQVGESWRPAGWSDDIGSLKKEDLEAAVAEAGKNLEEAIAQSAVSADRLEDLRTRAGDLAALEAASQTAADELAAAEERLATAEAERAALPIAQGHTVELGCPHCGGMVRLVSKDGVTTIEKSEKANLTDEQLKEMRLKIAGLDGTIGREKIAVRGGISKVEAAKAKALSASEAAKELAAAEKKAGKGADVPGARATLAAAQERLATWQKNHDAQRTHRRIVTNLALTGILAPTGLRKTVLARQLTRFHDDHVKPVTAAAGWPAVEVSQDLGLSFGGRALRDLGESHRWITATVLQVAVARADGSPFVLIDRADVCDPGNRSKLFAMLHKLKVAAVVGMTAGKADNAKQVPDLKAAKYGATFWIQDGIAKPLAEAIAK